jgi:hypothetical protein
MESQEKDERETPEPDDRLYPGWAGSSLECPGPLKQDEPQRKDALHKAAKQDIRNGLRHRQILKRR